MRTTLTLDADVAAQLEQLRTSRRVGWKELVNQVLRTGLRQEQAPPKEGPPFSTRAVSLGRVRIGNVDNVAEVLAAAESEAFG